MDRRTDLPDRVVALLHRSADARRRAQQALARAQAALSRPSPPTTPCHLSLNDPAGTSPSTLRRSDRQCG